MIISKSRMIKSLDQTWGGTDDHWIGFRNNTQETHGSWPSKYSCFRICFILYVQIREVARSFLSRWISEGLSVYHPKSWNLDTGRKNEGYNQHGDLTSQRDVGPETFQWYPETINKEGAWYIVPRFFPIAGWFSGISPGELWHLFTVIIGSFDPRGIEEWWVWVATPLLCIFSEGMSSRASGYSSGSVHIHRYSLHETRKFAGLSSKCLQTAGYIPACPHSIYSHS